jgi:hypothetical protein
MNALGKQSHLGHHWMHYACLIAMVVVVAALVFGAPALAFLGGLFCVAMMAGMVWMMAGMARHRR